MYGWKTVSRPVGLHVTAGQEEEAGLWREPCSCLQQSCPTIHAHTVPCEAVDSDLLGLEVGPEILHC